MLYCFNFVSIPELFEFFVKVMALKILFLFADASHCGCGCFADADADVYADADARNVVQCYMRTCFRVVRNESCEVIL